MAQMLWCQRCKRSISYSGRMKPTQCPRCSGKLIDKGAAAGPVQPDVVVGPEGDVHAPAAAAARATTGQAAPAGETRRPITPADLLLGLHTLTDRIDDLDLKITNLSNLMTRHLSKSISYPSPDASGQQVPPPPEPTTSET